jgi:hypothetical protein
MDVRWSVQEISNEKVKFVFPSGNSPIAKRVGTWARVANAKHVWIVWLDRKKNMAALNVDSSTDERKEKIILTENDIPGAKIPRESLEHGRSVQPNNPCMPCGRDSTDIFVFFKCIIDEIR